MNKEVRTREIAFNTSDNVLAGKAICFNEISNVLYDNAAKKYFREVIAPEAVTEELINNSDIKLLVDHAKDKLLARSRNGQGSLKLELREDGLYFNCDCPNTTLGRDIYELIKRGDYSQMSFAFSDGVDKGDITWDFRSSDVPVRTVHKISGLYDVAIVQSPAYDQTSVSARSIEEAEQAQQEEEKPVEQEEVKEEPTQEVQEVPQEEPETEVKQEPQAEEESRSEDTSYMEELKAYRDILDTL